MVKNKHRESGFSLIEAAVAGIIFTALITAVVPSLMVYKVGTAQNEMRLGAVAVSQRVLDALRRIPTNQIPSSGTITSSVTGSVARINLPDGTLSNPNNITVDSSDRGKNFTTRVTYCNTASLCDANSRQIQVEITYNGRLVYQAETLNTQFE